MSSENINLPGLVAELNRSANRSKSLKKRLRRPWTEPMGTVQQELHRLRRRTTELCILRARLRGRYHLSKPMRDGSFEGMEWNQERYHALVAARIAREFARPAAQATVSSC